MGIFKDYRTLSHQTREMSARHDVGGGLASMQAKMEALNNSMGQAVTGRAVIEGVGCRASVISAQPIGPSVNGSVVMTVDLLVLVAGRVPISVTATTTVPQISLSRATPGVSVPVRIVLDDPSDIFIDWASA